MPSGSKSTVFGTRFGFYLAAIGSAFGLGNLWRFPYVVSENGGGAFVLLYLFLVFLIGMPLLVAELTLGKVSRNSLNRALAKLKGESYMMRELREGPDQLKDVWNWGLTILGRGCMVITLMVFAYYAVISGWVLFFFVQLLVSAIAPHAAAPGGILPVLMDNGGLQILLASVHIGVVAVIVANDLELGMEKWVGYVMPIFVVLLAVMAYHALQLSSSGNALRFLFYPDFNKLTMSSLGQAIGHVLFTLSVGFGTMVTFGSYLRAQAYLPMAGFRVSTLDSVISIWAGMVIFPIVLMGTGEFVGPSLLFQSVPQLVTELPGGMWFGVGFFLCLYLSSLGASIGLFETVVANWREVRRTPRQKSAVVVALLGLLLAVAPALSSNVLSAVHIDGRGLLESLDGLLINWCLPIVALAIGQVVCWRLKRSLMEDEFVDPSLPGSEVLFRHWIFVLQFIVGPIILIGLLLQVMA